MKKIFTLLTAAALLWSCSSDDHIPANTVTGTQQVLRYGKETVVLSDNGIQSLGTVELPAGWSYDLSNGKITLIAPDNDSSAAKSGTAIIDVKINGEWTRLTVPVRLYDYDVITFDDFPDNITAGYTPYGENLYSDFRDTLGYVKFIEYNYNGVNLGVHEGYSWWDDYPGGPGGKYFYEFSYGGVVVSNWTDMTDDSFTNQCSVYADGDVSGSGKFAVSFGYDDTTSPQSLQLPGISFDEAVTLDGFYVNNTTYVYLAMRDGNYYSTPLEEIDGWFKLVITGVRANGTKTDPMDVFLADFSGQSDLTGIIDEWTWVDLYDLGPVTALEFDMQGSDIGTYGLNTPTYFCFDNLTLLK